MTAETPPGPSLLNGAEAYAQALGQLPGGPPKGPTERHAEAMALAELTAQGLHSVSHSLAQIAADLHAILGRLDELAPVAQAYNRGGKLAAAVAARQQRKDRTP